MIPDTTPVLAQTRRGDTIENRHWGWMVMTDTHGTILLQTPQADSVRVFTRSLAKPFQAQPLISRRDELDLVPQARAILCASHAGTPEHIRWVRHVLDLAGLNESALQCGPDWPVDEASRLTLQCAGEAKQAVYHNCSGKHAGMLLACQLNDWPVRRYLETEHPLQQTITETLQHMMSPYSLEGVAIDGCGAPVHLTSLPGIATMYARLVADERSDWLVSAMVEHPDLVGGEGRIDTCIMQAGQGQLVAKVGAEGLIAVAHRTLKQGLALKIADGHIEVRNRLMVHALLRLNWLDQSVPAFRALESWTDANLYNSQNVCVGHYEFPGLNLLRDG
jgi:L-asparaginase II